MSDRIVAGTSRREFVQSLAAWCTLPAVFGGDPYRPLVARPGGARAAVGVRGRVHAEGKGLARVGVSDGRTVVVTDPEGRFELVTTADRKFVSLSVPSGYELPTQPNGTTRCFVPLAADRRGEMAAEFALRAVRQDDDEHAFLVLADIQTQNREDFAWFRRETVPDVKRTVARLGATPSFGVSVGDITWDDLELYQDYERAISEVGIPFAQVVGNHDLDLEGGTDVGSTATFERRFGPRYYSFNRGQVHYVILDDVFYYDGGYLGYVDDQQLEWLRQDLALLERGRPVVVFLHIPLSTNIWERQGQPKPGIGTMVTNHEAVYRILEPYSALVLSGHLHESAVVTRNKVVERNHGTVCGAWWTGPICYDGTPSGYGVYRVKGSEIRPQYQASAQAPEHQIRVYPPGADPKAPDELVANVWQWERGWTVAWYQNGERRGAMTRRPGLDPLAVKLHSGPTVPAGRTWIEPVQSDHMFYAPAPDGAAEIRVEATDLFGRTFAEVLRPNG